MNAVHSSIDSHCLQTTNNDLFMTLEEKEALLTYVLQENAYLRKRLEHCQDRLLTLEYDNALLRNRQESTEYYEQPGIFSQDGWLDVCDR